MMLYRAGYLAVGIGSLSMGIACLTFALPMLFQGDAEGLFGLALGTFNIYWGCWGLRKSGFLEPDNDD